MVKYLVIGKDGQLGKEFIKRFIRDKEQYFAMGRGDLDVTNHEMVMTAIENLKPEIVINCAAYNNVDKAEERYDLAFGTNAIGVKNLEACIKCMQCELRCPDFAIKVSAE